MGRIRNKRAKLRRDQEKLAKKNAWDRPTWVPHNQLRYGVDVCYTHSFVSSALRDKGLSRDGEATREAIACGIARTNLGKEEWHYKKCRELLANAHKSEARQRELVRQITQPVA